MSKIDENLQKKIAEKRQELKDIFVEEPADSPYRNSELLRKLLDDFDTVTQHPFCNLSGEKRYEILRIATTLVYFDEEEEEDEKESYDFLLDQCQRNAKKIEFYKQELEQINQEWEAFKKQRAGSVLPDNLSPEKEPALVAFNPLRYAEELIAGMELKELIHAGNLSIQTARDLIQLALLKLEIKEDIKAQENQSRADILTGMQFDRKRTQLESTIIGKGDKWYEHPHIRLNKKILDILDATLMQKSKRNYSELEKILSINDELSLINSLSQPIKDKFYNLLLEEIDDNIFLSKLEAMLTEEKNIFLDNHTKRSSTHKKPNVSNALFARPSAKSSTSSKKVSTTDESSVNVEIASLTLNSSKSLSNS